MNLYKQLINLSVKDRSHFPRNPEESEKSIAQDVPTFTDALREGHSGITQSHHSRDLPFPLITTGLAMHQETFAQSEVKKELK